MSFLCFIILEIRLDFLYLYLSVTVDPSYANVGMEVKDYEPIKE